jgi:hypothetical protein
MFHQHFHRALTICGQGTTGSIGNLFRTETRMSAIITSPSKYSDATTRQRYPFPPTNTGRRSRTQERLKFELDLAGISDFAHAAAHNPFCLKQPNASVIPAGQQHPITFQHSTNLPWFPLPTLQYCEPQIREEIDQTSSRKPCSIRNHERTVTTDFPQRTQKMQQNRSHPSLDAPPIYLHWQIRQSHSPVQIQLE